MPPVFVLMGIQVDLRSLANPMVLSFGVVLILCALAGKLVCALGVIGCGTNRLAVAIGLIPRGEVGRIFAGIGTRLSFGGQPLLSPSLFSAIVLMVFLTTLVTPVGLRWAFKRPSALSRRESRGGGRLAAVGGLIQLLKNTAQGLEFRPKAPPVDGSQPFHGLLIAAKGFPGSLGHWAGDRRAGLRLRDLESRSGFFEQGCQCPGKRLLHAHSIAIGRDHPFDLWKLPRG